MITIRPIQPSDNEILASPIWMLQWSKVAILDATFTCS